MSFINYAAREINNKIVYYGCGLCGKTTNLQYVYGKISPQKRGELISLATETERTLFFDFLPLSVGQVRGFNIRFQLYTVPGQEFYDASRKLILRGVDGLVFVVDSQAERVEENLESFRNMEKHLADYGYNLDTIPAVLQYNKRDLPNVLSAEELDKMFNKRGWKSFEAVAAQGTGVFETLNHVCKLVLSKIQQLGQA